MIKIYVTCWTIWLISAMTGWNIERAYGQRDTTSVQFPLAVGNHWEYHVAAIKTSTDPMDLPTVSWQAKVVWDIIAREQVFGQDAFRVGTIQHFISGPDSGKVAVMESWFKASGDTLQAVGSRSSGRVGLDPVFVQLTKPVAQEENEIGDWHFVSLVYPLAVDKAWRTEQMFVDPERGDSDIKTVEAWEEVTVPGGMFEAFRVVYNLQFPGIAVRLEQWFAPEGIVRMRGIQTSSDLPLTDERGNLIGQDIETELTWEMELERFELFDPLTSVETITWGEIKSYRREASARDVQ